MPEVSDTIQFRADERAEPVIDAASLFRAHAPFIAAFLRRRGVAAVDVEDLVQDVFVIAHRKGGFVTGAAQPRSWLAAIAIHVAHAHRRTHRRRALEQELAAPIAHASDPADELAARHSIERVWQVLSSLPAEARAVFVRHQLEGVPCDRIAASCRVPIGTIYSRLYNARRRLLHACTSP